MWEILFVPVLVGNNVLRNVALNYADVHRRTCSSSRGEPTLAARRCEQRASIDCGLRTLIANWKEEHRQ